MKGLRMWIAVAISVFILTAAIAIPALTFGGGSAHANPNCAGQSTNFKSPNGIKQNFGGCR
jgi:hypothetical protein